MVGHIPFIFGVKGYVKLTLGLSGAGLLLTVVGLIGSLVGCIGHLLAILYQKDQQVYTHFYFAENWFFLAVFLIAPILLMIQFIHEIVKKDKIEGCW